MKLESTFKLKINPQSPFQGYHDIRFIQADQEVPKEEETAEDYEAQPHDCQFMDDMLLPHSVTLCIRDTFIKKNIDVYAKELRKNSEQLEQGILNG